MSIDDVFAADVRRFNREALRLAREMARGDKAQACLRLGLPPRIAGAIEHLSLDTIERLADTDLCLFGARFVETPFWEDLLEAARSGDEELLATAQSRAALLAAERAP